jgi:hypothetical protein
VPGAYGLGDSKEAAEADLREMLELLAAYEAKTLTGGGTRR